MPKWASREARPIHRVVFYEDWRPLTELEFGHAHPDFQMAVLPQARTEALLAEALAVFGVVPERGTALGSFEQDNDGVDAVLISADRSETFRAPIMLAADGARPSHQGRSVVSSHLLQPAMTVEDQPPNHEWNLRSNTRQASVTHGARCSRSASPS